MLTTYNEADMSAVISMRNEFKGAFEAKHKVRLGFMSFFVKACVDALHFWRSMQKSLKMR